MRTGLGSAHGQRTKWSDHNIRNPTGPFIKACIPSEPDRFTILNDTSEFVCASLLPSSAELLFLSAIVEYRASTKSRPPKKAPFTFLRNLPVSHQNKGWEQQKIPAASNHQNENRPIYKSSSPPEINTSRHFTIRTILSSRKQEIVRFQNLSFPSINDENLVPSTHPDWPALLHKQHPLRHSYISRNGRIRRHRQGT